MGKLVRMISFFCIGFAALLSSVTPGFAQQKMVRAQLGILIKSGDQTVRAKGKDRLKAHDLLRVYVYPEENLYIYVVHTDQKKVTLLKMVDKKVHSASLALPSSHEFYEVDGESPEETFTVICSPDELTEVSALAGSKVSREDWANLERDLIKRGEIDLGQKPEKPFAIAGNVRGEIDASAKDRFESELQIFTGNTILVKRYEFSVKK